MYVTLTQNPKDKIAVLRTTLVDLENGNGGSTGAIVAVVIVVLLLLVLLLLFYRRSNQKPLLMLPEDPEPYSTSQLQDHGVGDGQQQHYAEIDEGGHSVQQPYSAFDEQVANVGRNASGGDGQELDYADIDDVQDAHDINSSGGGDRQHQQQRDDANRCQYTQASAHGKQCKSRAALQWCVRHGCETANCSNSKSSRVKVCGLCQSRAEHSSSKGPGAGSAAARGGGVRVHAVADVDGYVPSSSLQTELYDTGAVPGTGGGS